MLDMRPAHLSSMGSVSSPKTSEKSVNSMPAATASTEPGGGGGASILELSNHPSSSAWVHENFQIGDVLGTGSFGTVYSARLRKDPDQELALKELLRGAHPKFIAMELKVLHACGGHANIIRLEAAFRQKDRIFIVMEYFQHDNVMDYIDDMTTMEKLDYIKNLLEALSYMHQHGFVHRDIKPSNFLYNRKEKRYRLIDFGLSETIINLGKRRQLAMPYHSSAKRICLDDAVSNNKTPIAASPTAAIPGQPTPQHRDPDENVFVRPANFDAKRRPIPAILCSCLGKPKVCMQCIRKDPFNMNKAGTPGFRSPEMLLQQTQPSVLSDIWAAGITLLSLCSKRHPVMRPNDNLDAILQLAVIFGSKQLQELAARLGTSLLIAPGYPGMDLVKFVKAVATEEPVARSDFGCRNCAKLLSDGNGQCLCVKSERISFEAIEDEDEYRLMYVLRKCLTIDPDDRFNADVLLSLLD